MCHAEDGPAVAGAGREEHVEFAGGGATVPAYLYPAGSAAGGAVLILHDVFGITPFYRQLGQRLAQAGHTALLPDLFVREGALPPSDLPREQLLPVARERANRHSFPKALVDIRAALAYLRRDHAKVGTVGFCLGGTLVMLVAAREPVDASVIFYGVPRNAQPTENRPHEPLAEADRVNSPLLGFWGDADAGVGMDNVEAYRRALTAADKPHDFTIYPDAPHGFLTFEEGARWHGVSQDAWQRTLRFYAERLR